MRAPGESRELFCLCGRLLQPAFGLSLDLRDRVEDRHRPPQRGIGRVGLGSRLEQIGGGEVNAFEMGSELPGGRTGLLRDLRERFGCLRGRPFLEVGGELPDRGDGMIGSRHLKAPAAPRS
ncbi:hypothetical protein BOS5A_200140 [Bosea sp. EC-HK365B]|nr:hypothetical protein BOS5A_200140 [Bosea sp. EC-HK365B]